ncbi:MAG TPA: lamin tail domain-containing protein, partial [Sulfurovum sp.]|nr:lamin tail domain-containing protein [Sulfurovum sp.]
PAYSFTLDKAYTHGVVTKEAENAGHGGWSVLYGFSPFGTSLDLAIDEETVVGDTTRRHIGEDVAYWVFIHDPINLAEMKINEILFRQTVNGTLNDEFIEFYVTASGDLKNYLVTDQDGKTHHYRFPKHSVSAGDYVVLHIGTGTDSVLGNIHHFYQNSSELLNNGGDEILLLKPSNNDVTIVDGKSISAVPFDYVLYDGGSDAVPTSANGVTVMWNNAYNSELGTDTLGLSISLSPNGVDGDTSACWELTASGNASDNGCSGYIITRDTNSNTSLTYSMGESNTLVLLPDIKLEKNSITVYDPINLQNNPKAIPNALVKYMISGRNEGLGSTDADSIVIVDKLPVNMKICVSTLVQCKA